MISTPFSTWLYIDPSIVPGGLHNLLGVTCGSAGRGWSVESRSRGLEHESGERVEEERR